MLDVSSHGNFILKRRSLTAVQKSELLQPGYFIFRLLFAKSRTTRYGINENTMYRENINNNNNNNSMEEEPWKYSTRTWSPKYEDLVSATQWRIWSLSVGTRLDFWSRCFLHPGHVQALLCPSVGLNQTLSLALSFSPSLYLSGIHIPSRNLIWWFRNHHQFMPWHTVGHNNTLLPPRSSGPHGSARHWAFCFLIGHHQILLSSMSFMNSFQCAVVVVGISIDSVLLVPSGTL